MNDSSGVHGGNGGYYYFNGNGASGGDGGGGGGSPPGVILPIDPHAHEPRTSAKILQER
jgi:hypothetical protein